MSAEARHHATEQATPRSVERTHQQPEASFPDGEAVIVQLNRMVGNQAVLRMMAEGALVRQHIPRDHVVVVQRKPTGLVKATLTKDFAAAALNFWKDAKNKDKPLQDLGDFLMGKVNENLNAIPSQACKHAYSPSGTTGAFSRVTWTITMNTSDFSTRKDITKVSDLNEAEVTEIVDTIYHEARHSEQYFRIARMLAGQGKDAKAIVDEMSIPDDVAAEAVKSPLDAKDKKNAGLLAEAENWRAITVGKYGEYKGEINTLGDTLREIDAVLDKADPEDVQTTLDDLQDNVKTVADQFRDFFDPEIEKIEKIKKKDSLDKIVYKHLKNIKAAFDAFKTEYEKKKPDLPDLRALFSKLYKVRYKAYRDFEHEKDAWAAGSAAGTAFKKLAKKK